MSRKTEENAERDAKTGRLIPGVPRSSVAISASLVINLKSYCSTTSQVRLQYDFIKSDCSTTRYNWEMVYIFGKDT